MAPALPTIYPTRKNKRELNMDSATGEKTPAHVPIVDWFHSEMLESSSDAVSVISLDRYYISSSDSAFRNCIRLYGTLYNLYQMFTLEIRN